MSTDLRGTGTTVTARAGAGLVELLFEAVTGRPYWTRRSMAAEYGPPPAAEFAVELAVYSDAALLVGGERIVAALRHSRHGAVSSRRFTPRAAVVGVGRGLGCAA